MPRKLDILIERMEKESETFQTLSSRALVATRDWIDYRSTLLMQEWAMSEHDPIEDAERRGKRKILDEISQSITDHIEQKARELEGQEEEE